MKLSCTHPSKNKQPNEIATKREHTRVFLCVTVILLDLTPSTRNTSSAPTCIMTQARKVNVCLLIQKNWQPKNQLHDEPLQKVHIAKNNLKFFSRLHNFKFGHMWERTECLHTTRKLHNSTKAINSYNFTLHHHPWLDIRVGEH